MMSNGFIDVEGDGLGVIGAKNAVAVCPRRSGAPETGIRRNCDLLTPQAEHLKPGT